MESKTQCSKIRNVITMTIIGLVTAHAALAGASAYTIDVYSPDRKSATLIEGWGNLAHDCTGTFGCWNYMKIERKEIFGIPTDVAGGWRNTAGWNSVSGTLDNGCHEYRTTVDSYNDVAGTWGGGINDGEVGVTADGTKIYRYHTPWSSAWVEYCTEGSW